ncbi:unnamed protein product [Bemisia tabaci]|uniref:C2H2-type domain-containing protein n=2 Tax=Bemisia tabaci TaxID=7038 RepID=A0A9P0ABH8_BEMTA|nr:unnamed protein product [Bemisia tabaci]
MDFFCEVCSGKFEPREGLRELLRHMKILHGFKSNVSTQHMLSQFDNFGRVKEVFSHIGPVFPCPFCPIRSSSKRLLRRHAIKFHGNTWLQDPPEGPMAFKCSICPTNFWQMNERSAHEYADHADSAILRCYHCWEPFFQKIMLNQHIKKSHPDAPLYTTVSYKCRQCRALCPSFEVLRNHFRDKHPHITVFRCPHCDVTLKTKKSLKAHFKGQHLQESGMYECDQCGKTVWSKRALGAHRRLKHMNSRLGFRCRLCGLRFANKDERKLHYQSVHVGESPYHCNECGKGFASKSGLYGHRQVHKSTDYFKCQYCEKEFTRKDSYNEHLLIHIGPRHRCPHCSKEFVQRSNMIRHIRIHTGEKPYKCTYCDKTFSDKGACNSHVRVHTGEETCACPFCGQTFSKKQKLKYHVRKHTGEGLVSCEVCNKVFTNSYTLKEHRLTHAKTTKSSKEAVCKHCGESFDSSKFLQRHAAIAHTSGVIFGCPFCEKIFTQQARLRSHIMAHADVKHLRCLLCEDAYSERRELQKHLAQKHDVDSGSPHYLTCFRIVTPEEIGLYIPMFHEDDFSQQTNLERDKILREYFTALTSGKIRSKDNQTVKFNFKLLATKKKRRSRAKQSASGSKQDDGQNLPYNLRENPLNHDSDSNEASVINQFEDQFEDPADQVYLAHLAEPELAFSAFDNLGIESKRLKLADCNLDVPSCNLMESSSPKKFALPNSTKKREKQKRKSKALPPRKLQIAEIPSDESEDFSCLTDGPSTVGESVSEELPRIPKITVKKSMLKESKSWAIESSKLGDCLQVDGSNQNTTNVSVSFSDDEESSDEDTDDS